MSGEHYRTLFVAFADFTSPDAALGAVSEAARTSRWQDVGVRASGAVVWTVEAEGVLLRYRPARSKPEEDDSIVTR